MQIWKRSNQRVLWSNRREFCSAELQRQDRRYWARQLPPQGKSPCFFPYYEIKAVYQQCFGLFFFILQRFFPYAVIKYDIEEGKPLRDSSGFCIEAAKGALVLGLWVPLRTQRSCPLFLFSFPREYGDLKCSVHNLKLHVVSF